MKKIFLGIMACFMLFVGVTAVGCGDSKTPPDSGEITEPSTPTNPDQPEVPEEPSPEVDFTEVIEELKTFLSYSGLISTDEYESEILPQKAYLKTSMDYAAAPVEDITAELAAFDTEGFSVECYEEEDKIVFAISAH